MTIVQMLSFMPIFTVSRYTGSTAATGGIILVEMKKNNASVHLRTGRNDNAYAAGVASATTRSVEKTLAISEFSRNGTILPPSTVEKCSKVGVKNHTGGFVVTSLDCLSAVSTIQMTGKTKMIA